MASSLWRVLSESYAFLKGVFRYKETLFWVLIFPLLWYGLMVGIWGNPNPPTVEVAVYNGDGAYGNSTLGDALVRAMNESGLFRLRPCSNSSEVLDEVKHGKAGAGLVVPANFTESIFEGAPAAVGVVYEKSRWGDFAASVLQGFLNGFADRLRDRAVNISISYILAAPGGWGNTSQPQWWGNWSTYAVRWLEFIREPVRVNETVITPPLLATTAGLRAYYALSMIGIEALFIGLFAGAQAVSERKRTGTLAVILSSPMRSWELMAADTISALAAIALTSLAVVAFSLATGARYTASPATIALAVALIVVGTLFTIGLGLLLAPLAKTPEGATVIVNAIAFPAMFVGGIAIPSFMLPAPLRVFADNWPLGLAVETARRVLIGAMGPAQALASVAPAIAATVAVYAAGLLVYKKLLARTIEYY